MISSVNVFCSENTLNNVSKSNHLGYVLTKIFYNPLSPDPQTYTVMYMYILSPSCKSLGQEEIIFFLLLLKYLFMLVWYL